LAVPRPVERLQLEAMIATNGVGKGRSNVISRAREVKAMPWDLTGNAGTTAANFLGTTDDQPLVIKTNNSQAMQVDPNGHVGIGTANATQQLTLGSSNIFLPNATEGTNGNLYFGGTTDTGQVGMRLFGGNVNGTIPSGFIDVRAGTLTDGLIFRVDTSLGGTERMRITASGTVEVAGTLNVGGDITMSASDFAEDFRVVAGDAVEPGTVMALDENGELRLSDKSYDRKVAGVISGAGDLQAGAHSGSAELFGEKATPRFGRQGLLQGRRRLRPDRSRRSADNVADARPRDESKRSPEGVWRGHWEGTKVLRTWPRHGSYSGCPAIDN
jgi:hypothetical protein